MNELRSFLRVVGSIWLAAVLLMLVLLGMACATVFESMRGAEQALAMFYRSWWFTALLALIFVNVAAATLARYPFSKALVGFVVTHASILVILIGALVTSWFGIDGMLGINEGQTEDHLRDRKHIVLKVLNQSDKTDSTLDLDSNVYRGFQTVNDPEGPVLSLGSVQAAVTQFFPDSEWVRQVTEDEDPRLGPAIEVSLSASGHDEPTWVFARHAAAVEGVNIALRSASNAAELERLLNDPATNQSDSIGSLKVACGGTNYEIPVADCTEKAVSVGDTGYMVRVLRYLPHATVGSDNRLVNASAQPENPAVEVELASSTEMETRICFARFPGFQHGGQTIEDVEITFVAADHAGPGTPVEVIAGPEGKLYARFSREGVPRITQELILGTPVDTPWLGRKFAVLRHVARARVDWSLEQLAPVREERIPAIKVVLSEADDSSEMWLQEHRPRRVTFGGQAYELAYTNRQIPLGFSVTLNRFRIGTYPGGNRPRSFESHVTILDPTTAREQDQIISMNHPAECGGFTLYQSSYNILEGQTTSYLTVSRDPGRPIVFVGYIALMIGMVLVLATRLASRQRMGAA